MPSILLVEQGNAHWCIIVGYILPRRYIGGYAGYIAAFTRKSAVLLLFEHY
jgi:hypothetical protein